MVEALDSLVLLYLRCAGILTVKVAVREKLFDHTGPEGR